MLNTERIRTMTKLHRMENGQESDYLKVNQIYRGDYIGLALIKNFFAVTFAYLLIITVCGLYHFEFLATEWFNLDLMEIIKTIVLWYVILLVAYSVLVYIVYSVRYVKMKKFIKKYDEELKNLETQYELDEGVKNISSDCDRRK